MNARRSRHDTTWLRVCLALLAGAFSAPGSASEGLSDPDATPETVRLYKNLRAIAGERLLVGQYAPYTRGKYTQPEAARAVEPAYDRTDMHALTGAHPAVVELGLHKTEHYDYWRRLVPELHRRGVVISFSTHSQNPDLAVPPNDSHKSNEGDPVGKVLDRNSADHRAYLAVLDGYADFLGSLKDDDGRAIPLLFRPYHEYTGWWFWWGTRTATPEQFNELWVMTVDYFRHTRGLHNLIWVISPSKPVTEEKYMSRFPGTDYVDVLGFDVYAPGDGSPILLESARSAVGLARRFGKIAAVTEYGYKKGISPETPANFYSAMLTDNILPDEVARDVAYAVTWFGREPQEDDATGNWSPYHDEPTSRHVYADFIKFRRHPWTAFEGDVQGLYGD
ncbi:MAG: glycosyl hydrolase [Planctomycetota bacterium]